MVALKEKYLKEVVPQLREELGIKNPMAVPRPEKVVVNMGFGIADKDAIKLVVENNNFLDMHVYGMRDGYYRSLGMVTGLSKAEFTIPESLTIPGGDFQILADPIGGTLSYQTDAIVLGTSKEVDLTIQNDLALSSFVLR